MNLRNRRELENARAKLRRIQGVYETTETSPAPDAHVRDLTLQSLRKLIGQLKEEITRYETHTRIPPEAKTASSAAPL